MRRADNPAAATIHRDLADRYAELKRAAWQLESPLSALRTDVDRLHDRSDLPSVMIVTERYRPYE